MSRLAKKLLIKPSKLQGFSLEKQIRFFSAQQESTAFDVVVVGGGIIGSASARELQLRHPNSKMAILEKESSLASHQSSQNSGVIHAGIYYKPGSLKAKLCGEGMKAMYEYCNQKEIPYKKIGKLIVATNELEVQRLKDLEERSINNKVPDLQVLNSLAEIQYIEPNCVGLKALYSPQTGIVDFSQVAKSYVKDFTAKGGEVFLNFEVNGIKESSDPDYPVLLTSPKGQTIKSKYVLTCAGLFSDRLAVLSGCPKHPQILPVRGEYLVLVKNKRNMVKGNIYPVPDPRYPFLGVHFTPKMNGLVALGPNAILATKREGYTWKDFSLQDCMQIISNPAAIKFGFKVVPFMMGEIMTSFSRKRQLKALQKYVPSLKEEDIEDGFAGVRAQALYENGSLADDFVFDMNKGSGHSVGNRVLHCRNTPSPGATSSLSIAKLVAEELEKNCALR